MYKVLIVDDEFLIVKSLKNRVKWKDCGFKVVGEAYNGLEAYEKILELKPDVVFTDIRMPGMGGLELVEKAFRQEMDVKFKLSADMPNLNMRKKHLTMAYWVSALSLLMWPKPVSFSGV
jgi:two-component system response regulator YesN